MAEEDSLLQPMPLEDWPSYTSDNTGEDENSSYLYNKPRIVCPYCQELIEVES